MSSAHRQRVARSFRRAARGFAAAAFLHAEIRARLLERLNLVELDAAAVVDLGAGPGAAAVALTMRFPQARVLALDLVPDMLAAGPQSDWLGVCADAASLPLADGSVDLVFSNLMLPCCESPPAVLAEVGRVLRHPGLFSFSTFGPDTMRELRSAWAEADRYSHVPDFQDMHNLGDALLRAGFAEPVVDAESLTITYSDLSRLAADLRAAGAVNLTPQRNRGLTGRVAWSRMVSACDRRRDAQGRLPVTVEVIYGQAWAAAPREAAGRSGEYAVPVSRVGRRR